MPSARRLCGFGRSPTEIRQLGSIITIVVAAAGFSGCDRATEASPDALIDRAREHEQAQDYSAAIIDLKSALQQAPDSLEARWLLASIYLRSGNGGAAEKEIRRSVELGLNAESAAVPMVRSLLLQKKFDEVREYSSKTISQIPEDVQPAVLALTGDAYLGKGDVAQAATFYDSSLRANESQPDALVGKARLAARGGDVTAAREYLTRVLERDPDFAAAWSVLGDLEFLDRNFEAAEKAYTNALRDPVNELPARSSRSWVYIQTQRFEEAARDIETLRRRVGRHSFIDFSEGLLMLTQQRYEEANNLFEMSLGRDPTYLPALYYAAVTNIHLGKMESARAQLERYGAHDRGNRQVQRLLAAVAIRQGDEAEAETRAKSVLDQSPDDAFMGRILASALFQQGKVDAGVRYLERAAAAQGEDPADHALLGAGYLAQGKLDDGTDELEQALRLDPQASGSVVNLVLAHLRNEEPDKALQVATAYREQSPDDVLANNLLGAVYLVRKEFQLAKAALARVLEATPGNPTANLYLAAMAVEEGATDEARAHYRAILEHHPGHLRALVGLAALDTAEGNEAGARALWQEAIESNPQELSPRFHLARHHLQSQRPEAALELLEPVRSEQARTPAVLALLAQAELGAARYRAAAATLERLRDLKPANPAFAVLLAQAYAGSGREKDVRPLLEDTVAESPTYAPARIALARLAILERDAAKADAQIGAIRARLGDDHADVLVLTGALAELREDFDGAVGVYTRLFSGAPTSVNLIRLARARSKAGDPAGAVGDLERWTAAHPSDIRALWELAQEYRRVGDEGGELRAFRSLLEQSPEHIPTLNKLALLAVESDPTAAVAYAERAYAAAPNVAVVMSTFALALLRAGDVSAALPMIERAVRAEPEDPRLLYRRAQVLEAAGRRGEAVESVKAALGSDSTFPERLEAEALLNRLATGS